eukprot:scaffold24589_cov113-Isochrysis_galbana.AAC.1
MVRRCRLSGPHRPRSCGILVGSPARAIGEYSRHRDGSGSSTYNNPHSPRWEALVAHLGLTDIYRLRHGALAGGYTGYLLRHNSHPHRQNIWHQTSLMEVSPNWEGTGKMNFLREDLPMKKRAQAAH